MTGKFTPTFKKWWAYIRTRWVFLLHRYGLLLASLSILLTYFTAIAIVFIYFDTKHEYYWTKFMVAGCLIVVAFIIIIIAFGLFALFICSFFPKGRVFFDGLFHYRNRELVSADTKIDELEKRVRILEKSSKGKGEKYRNRR